MTYRTMWWTTTKFTPFKLVYGLQMKTGVDFATPFSDESLVTINNLLSIIAKLEKR